MHETQNERSQREKRLDEAAAEYLKLCAESTPPDRQLWLAGYPDLAEELAEFLSDLQQLSPLQPSPNNGQSNAATDNTIGSDAVDPSVHSRRNVHRLLQNAQPTERYQLREFLAQGGMGEVWLAEDAHVGRSIAIKRIRDPQRSASTMEERFLVEFQIMGQLEHPCIVPLHDLGRDESGNLYAAMKLVKGCSLKQRLGEFHANKSSDDWVRQADFLRLLEAFLNVCRAVAYAHSRKVLHRDIKPDNIMLGKFGEALLLDWGLAKSLSANERQRIDAPSTSNDSYQANEPLLMTTTQIAVAGSTDTHAGTIMGSPAYMAPEAASGDSQFADQRTDVYLLGATLYEMLTGRPPRTGSSRNELIELARHTPVQPPKQIDNRIPKALNAICMRAMAHQRDQRYASAAELAADIENYLAGEPVSAHPQSLPVRCWRMCRRHRRSLLRTLLGMLFLAVGAAALFSYQHWRRLETNELARGELALFRDHVDETQFYAANLDVINEQAPYFDPQLAIQKGQQALAVASHWGDRASQFPIANDRPAIHAELAELLLLLANLHQQTDSAAASQQTALALLDQAAALETPSAAYYRIRSRCQTQLGLPIDLEMQSKAIANIIPTAQDYFLDGEDLRKSGQLAEASRAYQQALQMDSKHYWAHYQLARCYLGMQRGPEAIAALGTCIALRPDTPWAYSTRGMTEGLLGNFESAHRDLSTSLKIDPDFRPAVLHRGVVEILQGKETEALASLDLALSPPEDHSLIEAAYYRAQIYYRRGDLAATIRDCDSLSQQRPGFAAGHLLMAKAHFRNRDDQLALECVDKTLQSDATTKAKPNEAGMNILRGQTLREIAMGLDPTSQQHVLQLALHEFEIAEATGMDSSADAIAVKDLLGMTQLAIDEYSKRIENTPNDLTTRKLRGWNYIMMKQFDLALNDFAVAIQLAPNDAEAFTGLGYIHACKGEATAAEQKAVAAVIHGGQSYLVLHNVACVYAELAESCIQDQPHYEELAIALLERVLTTARQSSQGMQAIEMIRREPAFHSHLRSRTDFVQLLAPS